MYISSLSYVLVLGQTALGGDCVKGVETEKKYTERSLALSNNSPRPYRLIRLERN